MPIFFQGYRTFSHAAPAERLSTVSSPFLSYIGFTKIRAFVGKCCQKISTSVGFTKIRAFVGKCGQKISTSVGLTKIRAFAGKCGQNCANLLCRNIISRASPENKFIPKACTFFLAYLVRSATNKTNKKINCRRLAFLRIIFLNFIELFLRTL